IFRIIVLSYKVEWLKLIAILQMTGINKYPGICRTYHSPAAVVVNWSENFSQSSLWTAESDSLSGNVISILNN
ncbi:hypothetical protein, partial [Endozoicomonas sp.]|uniref:hypothetical protein n=1 Tax=Endozoicomonas sp. TaxID=1892382 RepID=UPI00383B95E9